MRRERIAFISSVTLLVVGVLLVVVLRLCGDDPPQSGLPSSPNPASAPTDVRRRHEAAEAPSVVADAVVSAPTSRPAGARTLVLLDPLGRPVGGASIFVFSPEAVTGEQITGPSGQFSCDLSSAVAAVIRAPGWIAFTASLGPETKEIELPRNFGAIAGKVLVDDAPAERGLSLKLTSFGAFLFPEGMPKWFERTMQNLPKSVMECTTTTDEQGRFSFFGVAPKWERGFVQLPEHLSASKTSVERTVSIPHGANDLILSCYSARIVTGRCVDSDSTRGVPGCSVGLPQVFGDTATTDTSGRFRLSVLANAVKGPIDYEVRYFSFSKRAAFALDQERVVDLGDIEIPCGYSLDISAVDGRGAPIKDFWASFVGANESVRSGADGHIVIRQLPPEPIDVDFCADRFQLTRLRLTPVRPAAGQPVIVELKRGGRLTIFVQDEERKPVGGQILKVVSERPLFPNDEGQPPSCAIRACNMEILGGMHSVGAHTLKIKSDPQGVAVLGAVAAGVTFVVAGDETWDPAGRFRSSPVAVGADGDASVTLEIDRRTLRQYRGRLATKSGAPVSAAKITLYATSGTPIGGTRSDDDGRIEFSGIATEKGAISVAAPGYAPLRKSVDFGTDGTAVETIVLDERASIDIFLVDADGRPSVDRFQVVVHQKELDLRTTFVEVGHVRFVGARADNLDVSINVGGEMIRQTLRVIDGACRFVVPKFGTVRMECGLGGEGTQSFRLRVTNDINETKEVVLSRDDAREGVFDVPLLPGSYVLQFDSWKADETGVFGWTEAKPGTKVRVVAGETVIVR